MVLVGNHRVFRVLEVPASDAGSQGLASHCEISISSSFFLILAEILFWLILELEISRQ